MSETKNNHFIPQFYLSAWADHQKKTFCLNKKTKYIFHSSIRNLCADRLWNPEIEKKFSELEEKYWQPVLKKLLRTENINILSKKEIENFLSFAIALKTRRKQIVDEIRAEVKKSQVEKISHTWRVHTITDI